MDLLHQQKIIVTGGASGIGKAICRCFIEQGAKVVCIDRDSEKGLAVAEELECTFIVADLSDAEQAGKSIQKAAKLLGGLTCLINNAGCGALGSLHNYSFAQFDRLFKANLYSVFYATKAALPLMKTTGGTIVNIASETAQRPTAGEAPYSAAKAGVISLTKSIALEYGPNIRCNAISPGVINTPMTEGILHPKLIEPMLTQCPLKRVGEANEIANAALFFASSLSSYINGQNLTVDGGLSLPQAGINDVTAGLTHMLEAKQDQIGST